MKLNLFFKRKSFVFGLTLVFFLLSCNHTNSAKKVALSDKGQALHSVVVSSGASETTQNAAMDLAEYLGRITGGDFSVTVGDGTKGIAVGSFKDFPLLELSNLFDPDVLTRRDEYLLRTHNEGVHLVGATDLAAQHAVWGFLYQLGYRQFFPTDSWEIIPEDSNLTAKLNLFEKPAFYDRNGPRIAPYSYKNAWQRWQDRNRMTSSFKVNTTHVYNDIINRNQEAFDKHPEYFALVDGVRGKRPRDTKFCISNEGLRKLVVEDAKLRVEENPDAPSISMDPSDGSNWCECDDCVEMGTVSDRVVILANEVAEAINKMDYGEKYVGIYAYHQHSPPPNVDVHPKVIVSIATHFIKGGYTIEELVDGWSKRTEMLGIREYHDVFSWSMGLPHQAKGANVDYLVEKMPYYYNQGARVMISESSDTWASSGLGYYLSAHIMWDIDAVNRVDEIIEDFLEKSFKEAKEPMRKFYHMINQDYETPRSNEDLLARMYGYIKEARELTKDPSVHIRLDELVLYSKYAELMLNFRSIDRKDPARDKAAQDLYRHTYRMQKTMLAPVFSVYKRLQRLKVDIPDEAIPGALTKSFPFSRLSESEDNANYLTLNHELEDMHPWKSSKEFTNDELKQIVEKGITTYKKDKLDFKPIRFSEDLVPAAEALGFPEVKTGSFERRSNRFRGTQKIFTWFSSDSKQLNLKVTGGIIYKDRGNVKFSLFSPQEVIVGRPVDTDESVMPDKEIYNITLKSTYDGMHELEWSDGGGLTELEWPEDFPMTVRSSIDDSPTLQNNRWLYFYVPKGTKIVGGFTSGNSNGNTKVHDGDENQVFDMSDVEGGNGYFSIPVAEGQDGKLWSFRRASGTQILMTVPPYLARNGKELLLPKEVVEADKVK